MPLFIKSYNSVWFILLFLICTSINISYGQIEDSREKPLKKALEYYHQNKPLEAIESFEDYFSLFNVIRKKDARYAFMLAELYRETHQYALAGKWYSEAYKASPRKYYQAWFYYALMKQYQGDYESALSNFTAFKKKYRKSKFYKENRKKFSNLLKACNLAPYVIDSPLNLDIKPLPPVINKMYSETSPLFLDYQSLLFSSIPSDSVITLEKGESEPHYHLYLARKKNNTWKVTPFWPEDELSGAHILAGSISPDSNKMYLTVCQDNNPCKLYFSDKKDGNWQPPHPLEPPFNDKRYNYKDPWSTIEPYKSRPVLYFSSDMPGGKGGYDIWYSLWNEKEKKYGEPKNCGGKINTPGNEICPFYDLEEGTLFFSSDFWPGLGGYDIFYTTGFMKKWEKPKNAGYPLNSSYNDRYYRLIPGVYSDGIIASDRPRQNSQKAGCCEDLYVFHYKDYVPMYLTGKTYFVLGNDSLQSIQNIINEDEHQDESRSKVLPFTFVELYKLDQKGNRTLIKTDTSDKEGQFFFTIKNKNLYLLKGSKPGYFSREKKISTLGRYLTDTLHKNLKLSLIPKKPIIIRNIYYPFDEYYLTDSAKAIIDTTLLRILQENPQLIVEISSHTDSKGTEEYNMELSQKRAESVVNYLISKGISPDRLKAKGYGESQPIAPNTFPDGRDNPEGRQKNRRTEFRVIGLLPQYSEIIYSE